ncbi:MAG TPA: CHAT domain-containing protein [Thermoanaerobaculia bacterium]|jgi:hypothetical protein
MSEKTLACVRLFWHMQKLKLLFLSASPGYLRSDRELRDIENRIRSAPYGAAFDVVAEWAVRSTDITSALLRHMPNIVHFSGHGEAGSGIFLEDERGRPLPLKGETLCRLLEPLRGRIRIVLLNACETRPIAEALRSLVDYTIAMRRPITDAAAIAFASAFYSALAHGQSVAVAFELALAQLDLSRIPEADIPDLVVRPGLPQETLLPPPTPPPPVAPEPPVATRIDQTINLHGSPVGTFNNNTLTKG